MEVLHDLVGYQNLKIYQNSDWFTFSLDSVLLSNFVTIQPRYRKILDLGTGNAPIPLILSTRTKASIVGVEIQNDIYDLAQKTIQYNHLDHQVQLLHCDMKDLKQIFSSDTFDVIVSNPPYFKYHSEHIVNENIHKTIARHEVMITLEELLRLTRYLLKNDGVFAMVHRTERMVEILDLFRKYGLEPKKIQFIYPKVGKDSDLFLIEGRKNGKLGLKILSPIYVHQEDGSYTDVILRQLERSDRYESEKLSDESK